MDQTILLEDTEGLCQHFLADPLHPAM
jgi:hypothetical protein